jgi:choline-sulfatase
MAALAVLVLGGGGFLLFSRMNARPRPWRAADDPQGKWNVLLVSLDTTRPDHLEACGGAPVPSPSLDRIRGSGFVFTEMITPAPVTLAAHSSLFTGQNPYLHGVHENVEYALPPGPRTLAEAFQAGGYATAGFVGAFVLNRRFGLSRGFDVYQDGLWGPEPGLGPQTVELRGEVVANRACAWINDYSSRRQRGQESRPFFLFVHFFDAHAPYRPPSPYDQTYATQPYDGELAYQDACLGRVLDSLERCGEAGRTLVWVVSDHGEGLGDHGEAQHSIFVYDPMVRVVSILRPPARDGRFRDGNPRMRIDAQTSLIDVAPTLLDLAGVSAGLPQAEGRTLRPLLAGTKGGSDPVYCETLSPWITYHWAPLRAVRTTEWKYIRAPKRELYDLRSDPGERVNLISSRPQEAQRLDQSLSAFLARSGESASRRQPTAEERERLRSLGYLGGEGAAPSEGGDLPDPKDMLSAYDARYREIMPRMYERRFDEAVTSLREALRADPNNNSLLYNLATALRGAGKTEEAGRVYRQALRVQPQSPRSWHGWGQALLASGKTDSAAWAFTQGIALLPASPDSWSGRAGAEWSDRPLAAKADLDSALARGGDPVLVHGLLARLYREELHDQDAYEEHLATYASLRHIPAERAAENLPTVR